MFTFIIILGHLAGFLAVTWLVTLLFRRRFKSDAFRRALTLAIACVLCAAYITGAFINAYTVRCTDYSLTTEKSLGRDSLRIAQISDCHLGVTLDGGGFARQLERIAGYKPDMLVITGDLVDDDTPYDDLKAACEALGDFDAPLGKYFVYGNHDGGSPSFGDSDLVRSLEENGVVILDDETVLIDDSFYICGRKDAYDRRSEIDRLLDPLDDERYIIVLDHQPDDYAAEAQSKADLVLSGHTHGGQLLPLPLVLRPIGFCDKVYGYDRIGGIDFIVTSGIGALKAPLRTGTPAEFVIIDITTE